jgi:hypothetical protein
MTSPRAAVSGGVTAASDARASRCGRDAVDDESEILDSGRERDARSTANATITTRRTNYDRATAVVRSIDRVEATG